MTSNGFAKNDDGLGKLHDDRDAVHITEIDNSCPSQLNSASAYLNTRPIPPISPIESYPINQTSKVRCLNNRPVPTDESTIGTYSFGYNVPRRARTGKNYGFFGKTLKQWFGI
ncbi:uncharacterized protein LOC114953272 [Acropora millepora]|uniref:uncharacterized protein LOC114953272 n=1 Tax=Acropora millepora TaxID=45264 RepID=UPI001CF1C1E8|nr:uncharacterized protein LOC114953272 [Acropora millepora]